MATKEKTQKLPKSRPKNSCFPSCFGFGGSASSYTKKTPAAIGSRKTKFPWISWSSFRKRKSGSKTVPVDVPVEEIKATREPGTVAEIRQVMKGVSEKTAGKRQNRGALERKLSRDHVGETVTVAEKADHDKSRKILAVESWRPTKMSAKDDTFPTTGSLSRVSELRRTRTRPSSPKMEPNRSLTTSTSFPPLGRRKSIQMASISRLSGMKTDGGDGPLAGKLDLTVGISILIVTLAILLLWGRFCAVVCTSAWFYFIPRLKVVVNSDKVAGNRPENPDINSSEYKKKVVLEGFLERNHRNPVAGVM